MLNNPTQIIYLNGASSSGKTTLAKALQNTFEKFFLLIGIDKIIEWMPEKFNNWTGGEAPREKIRGNRILGSARGQFHKVHIGVDYDLEIDTHLSTLTENIEKITDLMLK